jgi:tetraprenyl-beta-curcumene synthase
MVGSDLDTPPTGAPTVSRALGDRRLIARAGVSLVLANGRYWTSVAPVVRRELERWELRAQAIDDPEVKALALSKLDDESFHAEAAAMLATLAPRAHRSNVVEAIIALELLFDYLDGLSELPSRDPLREGKLLFQTLIDAVSIPSAATGKSLEQPVSDDGGYLEALSRAVGDAVARLPAALAITDVAQRIASRAGEAQTRMHAASQLGTGQLESWARVEAEGSGLGWREFVAGSASSVLVLHALIAAAADPRTTTLDAERMAEAYLSTCVVLTLLDGVVDDDQDKAHDGLQRPGYLSLFEDRDELPEVLGRAARRAATQVRGLPNGAQHVMLLTGVAAYYSSDPGAENELARPALATVRRALEPLISPTLAILRVWRGARAQPRLYRARGDGESYDETSVERGTVGPPRCCG